jgi:hypothetical protein
LLSLPLVQFLDTNLNIGEAVKWVGE